MSIFKTYPLIDPVPQSEDQEITEVKIIKPRARHIIDLVLAIGADAISNLLARGAELEATGKGDTPILSSDAARELLTDLLTTERADALFEAIGKYLQITKTEAEFLSIEDLLGIGKMINDFFPDMLSQIVETSSAMQSKSKAS